MEALKFHVHTASLDGKNVSATSERTSRTPLERLQSDVGDGLTNVWMYAVIAAGTLFVVFLAIACFTMSEFFRKGPRPRQKDAEKSLQGEDLIDGMQRETTFVSCNHVTRVAAEPECDSVSLVSADRTPPPPVGAVCEHDASFPATRSPHAAIQSVLKLHAVKNPSLNSAISNHSSGCVVNGASRNPCVNCSVNSGIARQELHATKQRKEKSNSLVSKVVRSVSRIAGTLTLPNSNSKLRFSMHDIDVDKSNGGSETIDDRDAAWLSPSLNVNHKGQVERPIHTNRVPSPSAPKSYSNSKPLYASVDKQEAGLALFNGSPRINCTVKAEGMVNKTPEVDEYHEENGSRFSRTLSGMSSPSGRTINAEENIGDEKFHSKENKIVITSASVNKENPSLANMLESYFSNRKTDTATRADTDETRVFSETEPLLNDSVPFIPQLSDDQYDSSVSSRMSESHSCPGCGTRQQDMSVKPNVSVISARGLNDSAASDMSSRSLKRQQLAVCKGPTVQIKPEVMKVFDYNENAQSYQLPNSPHAIHSSPLQGGSFYARNLVPPNYTPASSKRMGYSAFSSFDTETTSTVPSSSASCESIPSGVCDLPSDQSFAELSVKGQGSLSGDRSPRNIAMKSLQQGKGSKKSLKHVPGYMTDSGLGMKMLDMPQSTHSMDRFRSDHAGVPSIMTNEPTPEINTNQFDDPKTESDGELTYKHGEELDAKLALLSPFSSLDVDTKRMKLKSSHSCGHLDQPDEEAIHRAIDKLRLYVRYGSKFGNTMRQ